MYTIIYVGDKERLTDPSRVDLRPTTSNSTSNTSSPDALAPPLQSAAATDTANRRHSTLRDILSFRARPNASPDERISALRRLRESRRNGSGDVAASASASSSADAGAGMAASGEAEGEERRRSKRLSFFGAGRRGGDAGEGSSGSQAQGQRGEDEAATTTADTDGGASPDVGAHVPNTTNDAPVPRTYVGSAFR